MEFGRRDNEKCPFAVTECEEAVYVGLWVIFGDRHLIATTADDFGWKICRGGGMQTVRDKTIAICLKGESPSLTSDTNTRARFSKVKSSFRISISSAVDTVFYCFRKMHGFLLSFSIFVFKICWYVRVLFPCSKTGFVVIDLLPASLLSSTAFR